MDDDVLKTNVFPLMGNQDTVTLGISTPNNTMMSNTYERLLSLKKEDNKEESLFEIIDVALMCPECTEKGVYCPHREYLRPAWRPKFRDDMIKRLYGAADQKMFFQETAGTRGDDTRYVYPKSHVDAFAQRPPHDFSAVEAGDIYSAIDPGGGGTLSDFVVVSTTIDGGKAVIVGADACSSKYPRDIDTMLLGHMRSIRSIPRYKLSRIILCVENNYGGSPNAGRIIDLILNDRSLRPCGWRRRATSSHDTIGIWTDHNLKQKYADMLARVLEGNSLEVARAAEFATNVAHQRDADDHAPIVNDIIMQMRRFRYEIIYDPSRPFIQPRFTMTGKQPGMKDDLAFALMMSLFWLHDGVVDKSNAVQFAL